MLGPQARRGDGRGLGRWRAALLPLHCRRKPGGQGQGRGEVVTSEPSLEAVSRLMELFCVSSAAVATGLHVSVNTHISLCPEERVFTKCTLKIKFLKTKREKIFRDEQ